MPKTMITRNAAEGPRMQKKHYSYDESVDESAKLIEDEPAEVEAEIPADESAPIENIDEDRSESPMI